MARLIVNADDLGLTPGVNRGIIEAHRRGIVTSATMMAGGAAFEDARQAIAHVPTLAIGCHIDLVQLAPALPAAHVRSLVEGSVFRRGAAPLAMRSFVGSAKADEIAAEALAQMRKLQTAGFALSHFDTHKHTHIFPAVLKPLLRAARECGVRAVRNPFEPAFVVRWAEARSRGATARFAAVRLLGGFAGPFRRAVSKAGLFTTDGTVGIALTGHLDQNALCELLRRIPEGTWELVVHPAYFDPPLAGLSRLTEHRETELALLTAAQTRQVIEDCGLQLISYLDLAR